MQRHLTVPARFLTLWPEAAERARRGAPADAVLDLSSRRSPRVHKLLLGLFGKRTLRALCRERPRPVIAFGSDLNPVEVSLIRAANAAGARTVLVQDGFVDSRDPQRIERGGIEWRQAVLHALDRAGLLTPLNYFYGSGGCGTVCVYGPSMRDLLLSQGVAAGRVVVTGAARFDSLFGQAPPPPAAGRPRILCLGLLLSWRQWGSRADDARWLRLLQAVAAAHPEWDLVLRPHPADPWPLYETLLGELRGAPLEIDRQSPLGDALAACGAVVMHFPSSVLFEAMIAARPVVLLDLGLDRLDSDVQHDPAVRRASTADELALVLAAEIASAGEADPAASRKRFLQTHLGFTDGRSAERVAAVLDGR